MKAVPKLSHRITQSAPISGFTLDWEGKLQTSMKFHLFIGLFLSDREYLTQYG